MLYTVTHLDPYEIMTSKFNLGLCPSTKCNYSLWLLMAPYGSLWLVMGHFGLLRSVIKSVVCKSVLRSVKYFHVNIFITSFIYLLNIQCMFANSFILCL